MRDIPQSVLEFLASLPEGKPVRVVLNTNGNGVWQAEEIHIMHRELALRPLVPLPSGAH